MLYINNAKVRKLIGVKRQKRWVGPGETVNLDSYDIRTIGANAIFFEPYKGSKLKKPAEKKVAPADKKNTAKEAKEKEADDKKALKESLEGMTKVRLIEVAEGVVGIDVKSRDNKAKILKRVLKASKEKGYAYVLKNS